MVEEIKSVGSLVWETRQSMYERYVLEQGIPVFKAIGINDTRDLDLAPWERMGGKGAFIQLEGLPEANTGWYAIEVPAGGALNPERHVYEELFYVVEGRGTTEVWQEGSSKRQVFEWQPGSFFGIPLNQWHRVVNATSSPALLLAATSAPLAMNLYKDPAFIFDNPYAFASRFDGSDEFYKPDMEIKRSPEGRGYVYSSIMPDIRNCELAQDNQRSPGYKFFWWGMTGTEILGHMGEYMSGRYARAHFHGPGAVFVCLRGRGYSISWPVEYGPHPWEAGKGEFVTHTEYGPGGMVSAAPGAGERFHQHFSIGKDPLRILAVYGWGNLTRGEETRRTNLDMKQGGKAIEYRDEDPQIRRSYEAALAREGVTFTMPEQVFEPAAVS